mmetsp:Transcript_11712/g.32052  ORF Transcript_11712/g.32052 Transcript_11712/m.32052 type:complete len:273 (+) Transcript_11712:1377-2195(+)
MAGTTLLGILGTDVILHLLLLFCTPMNCPCIAGLATDVTHSVPTVVTLETPSGLEAAEARVPHDDNQTIVPDDCGCVAMGRVPNNNIPQTLSLQVVHQVVRIVQWHVVSSQEPAVHNSWHACPRCTVRNQLGAATFAPGLIRVRLRRGHPSRVLDPVVDLTLGPVVQHLEPLRDTVHSFLYTGHDTNAPGCAVLVSARNLLLWELITHDLPMDKKCGAKLNSQHGKLQILTHPAAWPHALLIALHDVIICHLSQRELSKVSKLLSPEFEVAL